jgi:diaminopimelate epimerase
MTVINANGSFAPTCGNGLRCVVAYLYTTRQLDSKFVVATDSGDKEVEVTAGEGKEWQVSIKLGSPGAVEELSWEA